MKKLIGFIDGVPIYSEEQEGDIMPYGDGEFSNWLFLPLGILALFVLGQFIYLIYDIYKNGF